MTIREIARAIVIIAFSPAPTQTIIIGPSATFGRLFNTTRNGSLTLEIKLDHHNIVAIKTPSIVPKKKPISVSESVTPKCVKRLFEDKSFSVNNILLGLLVIKSSIISFSASHSHTIINASNMRI